MIHKPPRTEVPAYYTDHCSKCDTDTPFLILMRSTESQPYICDTCRVSAIRKQLLNHRNEEADEEEEEEDE